MSVGMGGIVMEPGGGWWASGSGSKSAVQLLQESKSRYVKSDHVLVSRQTPERPERLSISSNPNIFLSAPANTLHVSRPSPAPDRRNTLTDVKNAISIRSYESQPQETAIHAILHANPLQPPVHRASHSQTHHSHYNFVLSPQGLSPPHTILNSNSVSLSSQPPPLPSRSPRVAPRPRGRAIATDGSHGRGSDLRRSLSHGPGDRSEDVQMKLRRLLNTDSRENLSLVVNPPVFAPSPPPAPPRGLTSPSGTFRAEPATVTAHKSMPDLAQASSSSIDSEYSSSSYRRPSYPGALSFVKIAPIPPPRPPRMFRDPPEPPERPPARPPPPRGYGSPLLSRNGHLAGALISDGRRSSDSDVSACGGVPPTFGAVAVDIEGRRRPILRSKSDATHERGRWEEDQRASPASAGDLEDFFESMGLDHNSHQQLASPGSTKTSHSSPVYFEEISSEDSGPLGGHRGSSGSDDARATLGPGPGLSLSGPGQGCSGSGLVPRTGEPSIVEKNARVIKWLFNCQKAQGIFVTGTKSKT
ncbi:unnamed protein product [Meganyctiphanes norvegica]|uniref:Centrosome-associated FAM110 C-terminal domain-containing protein n=1 Tax=Meganyctiphanes norvegica TaxID=48144 RepID=A0AAV2RPI3_MEGNR